MHSAVKNIFANIKYELRDFLTKREINWFIQSFYRVIYDGFHSDRRDIRKVDAINTHTYAATMWKGHCSTYCARGNYRFSVIYGEVAPLLVLHPQDSPPLQRRLRLRICPRRSFTMKYSPYAASAPVPTARVTLLPFVSLSLSRFLFASLTKAPSAFARPPVRRCESYTARVARLSMRRVAHASRLRTPVPTDAARGALTSPAATRKSGNPVTRARWSPASRPLILEKARRCKMP